MERIVIVGYKPIKGKENTLLELVKTHWQRLKDEDLVSDRKSVIVQAQDGTIIEIFGWKSKEAMNNAHSNKAVLQMWQQFSEVCEYVPIGQLEEFQNLFSEFTPIN